MTFPTPKLLAVSVSIAFGLSSAAAFAAPPTDPAQSSAPMQHRSGQADSPASVQARFEALDLNHDNYIDKTEASANKTLTAQFDKLDANHDGKLSQAEFGQAKGLASPTASDGDIP